ncbi:MAG: FKBP-type peptidyl-prolyl cis-trans isomerase [Clostridia bacterium]|nr:FKBP-type peptidyl-prolyl cis-trans isomerase [Clostridia bacterium]
MNFKKLWGVITHWLRKYYIVVLGVLFVAVLVVGVFFVYSGGEDGEDGSGSSEESKEEKRYYVLDLEDIGSYVEVGSYKGVEIEYDKVTDELIDKYRKMALDSVKEYVDTGKPAEKGNTVTLDYEGSYKDSGEKFSGGSATNAVMESLGDAGYIDGFEDAIVGHSAGEEFDIFVTFPDNYGTESLRGVEARFKITLKKVTKLVYPEITDELAKKLKYKDAADLNDRIYRSAEKTVDTQNMDKAWKAAVAGCKFIKYPENLYNQAVSDFVLYYMDYYKSKAAEYGVELEELMGQTEESLMAELMEKGKENANGYVKEEVIMFAIAKDMGVDQISKEDYDKAVQEFAEKEGVTTDKLKETYNEQQLKINILWDRVMNYVYENAIEKTPEESSEVSDTVSEDSEDSSEDSEDSSEDSEDSSEESR